VKILTKSIGELSEEIKTGKTPPTKNKEYFGGEVAWYTPGDLDGTVYLDESTRSITILALQDKKAAYFDANVVLISCIGDIGKVGITSKASSANQQITGVRLGKEVDPLFFLLWCKAHKKIFESRARNAVMPILNNNLLSKIKISFPEKLENQIRIATLLSRVEALITTRKENLRLLDEFLKSTFLEMFGDPVRNEKGWAKDILGNILDDVQSGWSPKCEAKPAEKDKWGILKLGAVTYCQYNENENKALKEGMEPRSKIEVKKGDLLFSRKNTQQLVAACSYVFQTKPKLMMPDLIFRLVLKEDAGVDPIFLWKLLVNERQRLKIQSLAGGAAGSMPNISKAKLKTVEIPIPLQKVQNQFTIIVEKVEQLKKCYQQNFLELQNLYEALSQKAFKGELDLNNISTEKVELNEEKEKPLISPKMPLGKVENHITAAKGLEVESTKRPDDLLQNPYAEQISVELAPKIASLRTTVVNLDIETFKWILSKNLMSKFTFEDIKQILGERLYDYQKVKEFMQLCLEAKKPFLCQKFDQQEGVDQMFFCVNK